MKKVFSLCIALAATTILWANVITGKCGDNLNWSYDTQTKALSITGSERMYDFDSGNEVPWGTVASAITSISLPSGLTSIGNNAFCNCEQISEIQIPQTVKIIGESAFYSCYSLTYVSIPASVDTIGSYAFCNCRLNNVDIAEGVQVILGGVFASCNYLTSITLPSTIKEIGNGALYDILEIHCLATTPPTISSGSVNANAIIYIPCNSVSTYLGTQYWQFLNLFGEMDYRLSFGNSDNGSAKIKQSACSMNTAIIEATPASGWIFDKWSDGNTDNPRTITLTNDTTLTPLFKKSEKQYTVNLSGISYASFDGYGSTSESSVSQTVSEGTYVWFDAISNCGTFEGWSDGNTSTSREMIVTCDTTISATYSGIETYNVNITAGDHGRLNQEIVGQISSCASSLQVTAYADEGYHFQSWSDGNTNNWRTIEVYSDTTITALFAKGEYGGKCGEDLMWIYEDDSKKITITGSGLMEIDDYHKTSWFDYGLARTAQQLSLGEGMINIDFEAFKEFHYLQAVAIPASVQWIDESAFEDCRLLTSVTFGGNNLTRIGNWAFYNCHELQNLTLPEGVQDIGHGAFFNCVYLKELSIPSTMKRMADNSFAKCEKLKKITVYAVIPPDIDAKTFEDVDRNIPVYVPDESVEGYKSHVYWKEFNIQGGATPTNLIQLPDSPVNRFTKIIKDGQLYILRDGKMYNAQGGEL